MGLIKFITVFDDEGRTLLSRDMMGLYNIATYPPAYYFDDKVKLAGINTTSTEYYKHKAEFECIRGPVISSKVFSAVIETAYENGYALALIVCPNKKWYPYYNDALKAVKNFKRRTTIDFTTFDVRVIDSKSFAAGSLYFTLNLARMHELDNCPTGIVLEDAGKIISRTIVLTKSGEKFGFENGNLAAFRVFDKRFYTDVDISESSDYVKFNNFAAVCEKYIRLYAKKYIVSLGAGCDFAANVIGRLEKLLGYPPAAVVQYSVASADVFGLESLCIHF